MIKKTLYFGNPVYLSLRNAQLVIKLPDVEKATALPDASCWPASAGFLE